MNPDPYRPPPPPPHAPVEGYRPLSGLCISSFVLALVLSVAALLTLWPGVLLPLALALAGLLTVDARLRRGRAFAWWALGLSLAGGTVGYFETRAILVATEHVAGGVVAALRARGSDAERAALLDAWLEPSGGAALRERVQARFADAVKKVGAPTGGPLRPSLWSGMFPCLLPPSRVVAVDSPLEKGSVPTPGTALWARVPFERATLHLALIVGRGDADGAQAAWKRLADESADLSRPVAVLSDVRFFAEAGALPPDAPPTPPTPPVPPGPAAGPQAPAPSGPPGPEGGR